ncbi:MAG: GNAT family N-acetyltransferase [Anaerolineae bacterium]|nr:GNAT family N-acetyltransferase [Anaerolineae bacterium]
MMHIQIITQLTFEALQPLLVSSLDEGYTFIHKLWDEYQSGENTFSDNGAILLGGYEGDQLVGIGGVHVDPYLKIATIGRVRHVYVLPSYRRSGIGKKLVQALIDRTSHHFTVFTLRTMTEHGQAFYKSLGFTDEPRFANATHWLAVKEDSDSLK